MIQQPIGEGQFGPEGLQFSLPEEAEQIAAWTEIKAGRFMPRRVRGSYQGRVLG